MKVRGKINFLRRNSRPQIFPIGSEKLWEMGIGFCCRQPCQARGRAETLEDPEQKGQGMYVKHRELTGEVFVRGTLVKALIHTGTSVSPPFMLSPFQRVKGEQAIKKVRSGNKTG